MHVPSNEWLFCWNHLIPGTAFPKLLRVIRHIKGYPISLVTAEWSPIHQGMKVCPVLWNIIKWFKDVLILMMAKGTTIMMMNGNEYLESSRHVILTKTNTHCLSKSSNWLKKHTKPKTVKSRRQIGFDLPWYICADHVIVPNVLSPRCLCI